MSRDLRLPDLIVVGTRKSGTTTLHRWLDAQPEIAMPDVKEPNFFSRDDEYAKGLAWYASLFAGTPGPTLTGEASAEYSSAACSATAASRIVQDLPHVKLLCLLRDPLERARSHYRHEVQRGRETRAFADAIADPDAPYVNDSRYTRCVLPFAETAGDRLCVVRFEDVFAEPAPGWTRVLAHLGLAARPHPSAVYNVTEDKAQFRGLTRRLFEQDRLTRLQRLPRWVRRPLARLGTRRGGSYRARLDESHGRVEPAIVEQLRVDAERLAACLERPDLVWPIG